MRRAIATAMLILAPLAAPAEDRVVAYRIVDADQIPASLTGATGDAERGRALYADPEMGDCVSCHGLPGEEKGAEAPALEGIARRLPEGRIRLWIVAPEVIAPGTEMPAYYKPGQRDDPKDPRFGEPRLSAGEIEDIVAYLLERGG